MKYVYFEMALFAGGDEMDEAGAADPRRIVDSLGLFERIRLFMRLSADPRVATWAKVLVPTLAAIYVISPIDLIPDFLIGPGQLDDLGAIGVALLVATRLLPRLAPAHVVREHLGRGAERGSSAPPRGRDSSDDGSVFETSYRFKPAGQPNAARGNQ